jgi:hypothetical protein
MDSLVSGGAPPSLTPSSVLSQIFSTSPESLSEIYNPIQYILIAYIPIYLLNKLISKVIPEPNIDSSSLVILSEIVLQICITAIGFVLIYRLVNTIPTFSGYKYETLALAGPSMILIVLLLSIQSKVGIKTSILANRAYELWNGPEDEDNKQKVRKNVRVNSPISTHNPSQADFLDHSTMNTSILPPPTPISTKPVIQQMNPSDSMYSSSGMDAYMGPAAANTFLGSAFGSKF